ncbi:MAG: histidine phosphatase family protein [Acidimicrobiia bacterium]|nr:histidine phosphatase family protein [Acidimicrobiia bacterium]
MAQDNQPTDPAGNRWQTARSSGGRERTTDRYEAPMYLARYRERQPDPQTNGHPTTPEPAAPDDDRTPLYLQRFRQRSTEHKSIGTEQPLWRRADLSVQQALTEDNRNKEISAPAEAYRQVTNDVYLIRHGETQGYSTDSGLTPQGAWQAHSYGRTLARRIRSGETVVFRHAPTNRARETAEQIRRGLGDGLEQYEKEITIVEPDPMNEFRNFQFVSPDGLKDVTAAFREYHALLEQFERSARSDRPLWLVEMDRFWRTQQGGGDPIQHWLTIPLLHFEPPAMCVRRFWAGLNTLSKQFPGARLAVATHSGCIRAVAVSALGYDPGEPYNTEHVRIKLYADTEHTRGGTDATVAYRNRVQEIKVPRIDQLPQWSIHDDWSGFADPSELTEPSPHR